LCIGGRPREEVNMVGQQYVMPDPPAIVTGRGFPQVAQNLVAFSTCQQFVPSVRACSKKHDRIVAKRRNVRQMSILNHWGKEPLPDQANTNVLRAAS
jgi:hypothetical protein